MQHLHTNKKYGGVFMSEEKKEKEKSAEPTEELKETGSANLEGSRDNHRIKLLTIVGEIEGHEAVSGNTKATKFLCWPKSKTAVRLMVF